MNIERLKELSILPKEELINLLSNAENERDVFKKEIKKSEHKIDFYDAVVLSDCLIDINDCSKELNYKLTNGKRIGRNMLFRILRETKILFLSGGYNIPFQVYIDNECFKLIETMQTLPSGKILIHKKTLVYQKGLQLIKGVLDDYLTAK
jgi:phage antirepressor YoqD-like protein